MSIPSALVDAVISFSQGDNDAATEALFSANPLSKVSKIAQGVRKGVSSGTKGAGSAVNNANKVKLNKQLASQEQVGQINGGRGMPIAGLGTLKVLREARRLASQYGGNASDWVKVRSRNRRHTDGFNQEIHAYQNDKIGKIVELKTKIAGH